MTRMDNKHPYIRMADRIRDNAWKIKTSRAKAVYVLLCAIGIPLRRVLIQDLLNISKATVHRALVELSALNLVEKDEEKIINGYPSWKAI